MRLLAWLLGALLAYTDGMTTWAELGAKWPDGGSYVFLQKLYGAKAGRLMAFLFIWQTLIQAPLVAASSAIGFSQYLTYLVPLAPWQQKIISAALVIFVVMLLYRNIKGIGKISLVLSVITVVTILWLIVSAIGHFNTAQAFYFKTTSFTLAPVFFVYLGQSSVKAIYSYLGDHNVCHLGMRKNPERNIPRSIFISITGIAILYILMQIAVMVLSLATNGEVYFIVSAYFRKKYITMLLPNLLPCLFFALRWHRYFPCCSAIRAYLMPQRKTGTFSACLQKFTRAINFPTFHCLLLEGSPLCSVYYSRCRSYYSHYLRCAYLHNL